MLIKSEDVAETASDAAFDAEFETDPPPSETVRPNPAEFDVLIPPSDVVSPPDVNPYSSMMMWLR